MSDMAEEARRRYDDAVRRFGEDSPQAQEALWYLKGAIETSDGSYTSLWDRLWPDNAWNIVGTSGPGKKGDQYRTKNDWAQRTPGRSTYWGSEGPRRSMPNARTSSGTQDWRGSEGPRQRMPRYPAGTVRDGWEANPRTAGGMGPGGGGGGDQEGAADKPKNPWTKQYRQGVFDWIEMQFEQLGSPELGRAVRSVLQGSRSQADAYMKIRELPEYAARFPGNIARIKAGLTPLDELAYLEQEKSYRQILSYYGLPSGFYDDNNDFANWIAGDVSPEEIGQRVSMATRLANNADPNLKRSLKQFYGVTDGDLTAYFLDRKRTTDILERQVRAAEIGAETLRSGVLKTGRKFAEGLVDAGIEAGQARAALNDVADEVDTVRMLGDIEGNRVSRRDQVEAKLGIDTEADSKVRGLKSRERARFGGSAGGTRVLGSGDAAGSF